MEDYQTSSLNLLFSVYIAFAHILAFICLHILVEDIPVIFPVVISLLIIFSCIYELARFFGMPLFVIGGGKVVFKDIKYYETGEPVVSSMYVSNLFIILAISPPDKKYSYRLFLFRALIDEANYSAIMMNIKVEQPEK